MSRWIFGGNLALFHYNSARHACAASWRNWATCTGTAKFPILEMAMQLLLSLFIRFLPQNTDKNSAITERQAARRETRWGKKRPNLKIRCRIRYPKVLKRRQSERLITLLRLLRGCIIFDIFFHSPPFCFLHLQNVTLSLSEEIAFWRPPSFLWQLLQRSPGHIAQVVGSRQLDFI